MLYIKKFTTYLFLYFLFFNNILFSYIVTGECYKFKNEQSGKEHTVLILVDRNLSNDTQTEKQFKTDSIPAIKKLLLDDEINLILDVRLEHISGSLKSLIDSWGKEFEEDPSWNSIIEQNYSNRIPTAIAYRKMALTPKEATKLFVILSQMKNYITNLPLKNHLNYIKKISNTKEVNNNFFESCKSAQGYYKLNNNSVLVPAMVSFSDWRTPTITNITNNYKKGLQALSQDLYLIENQSYPNFIADIARKFVPQTPNATEFSPSDTLKTKDLLDDLDGILKKLTLHESISFNNAERKIWLDFRNRIQMVKEYICNSISLFNNLPIEDKKHFEQLFKAMPKYQYAQLHWFAIVYAYLLKDTHSDNNHLINNEWIKIITEELLYIGLVAAIVDSKNQESKAVVYLSENNHKLVTRYLLDIGYIQTLSFDNADIGKAMHKEELKILVNALPVNISKINQTLQKPLSCSILI